MMLSFAIQEAAVSRVPLRRFYNEAMTVPMRSLTMDAAAQDGVLDGMGWTGRRVLGFKLPPWQRREVWTDAQCASFIESVYLGANIGQFMVNLTMEPEFDRILLDGQQRLRAIGRYVAGGFAVPGEDGAAAFWPELASGEQAHFHRIGFPWLATAYRDEATLREAYNRHNFSGTGHLLEEMAEPGDFRPSPPGFHGL
jgi:hypothetical protein